MSALGSEGLRDKPKQKEELDKTCRVKQQSFDSFLSANKENVNEETIFQVLQSHGKIDECIKYAELIKRYDTVIVHYINKQDHVRAL